MKQAAAKPLRSINIWWYLGFSGLSEVVAGCPGEKWNGLNDDLLQKKKPCRKQHKALDDNDNADAGHHHHWLNFRV